jgi:hypothetical protein
MCGQWWPGIDPTGGAGVVVDGVVVVLDGAL